jgi:5-methylcytosine-specific restriction endonuclease McrA
MPIDPYKRKQVGLKVEDVYPQKQGLCSYCDAPLPPKRKRWCSKECATKADTEFWVIWGHTQIIRAELAKRDNGVCASCGYKDSYDGTKPYNAVVLGGWEADHIKEVRHGGGGCTLDNFQTLCYNCHVAKTKANYIKPMENAHHSSLIAHI